MNFTSSLFIYMLTSTRMRRRKSIAFRCILDLFTRFECHLALANIDKLFVLCYCLYYATAFVKLDIRSNANFWRNSLDMFCDCTKTLLFLANFDGVNFLMLIVLVFVSQWRKTKL